MMEPIQLSYWDKKRLAQRTDVLIIGAGITGLSCAMHLSALRPNWTIRLVDKHHITRLASTRNAGFACFGSLTEVLDDIERFGEEVAIRLVERRCRGLELIQTIFEPHSMDYSNHGGFELLPKSTWSDQKLDDSLQFVNERLSGVVGRHVFEKLSNDVSVPFNQNQHVVKNRFEGQLNPAKYVDQLFRRLPPSTTELFSGVEVQSIGDKGDYMAVETNLGEMQATRVIVATNGLTGRLGLAHEEIIPARNMVLVSDQMDIPFKGVFHAEKGYIYFRNIDNRLLIGGGRHWDLENENVGELGSNQRIIEKLKSYVHDVILPNRTLPEFPYQWSGIMGMTKNKTPIVTKVKDQLFLAAGFSGMGVALGMQGGFELANLVCKEDSF